MGEKLPLQRWIPRNRQHEYADLRSGLASVGTKLRRPYHARVPETHLSIVRNVLRVRRESTS